jgi:hypothetical protein
VNYSLLALTMVVAYGLFAVGSQVQSPPVSASGGADSTLAKRAKPADEQRVLQAKRG